VDRGQEIKNVTRGAATVGGATLISRALGFLRDVVLAYFFGAAGSTDAFFVAFRISNMFRRLLGEGRGSLVSAFIPIFSDSLENKGERAAKDFFKTTLGWFALTLAVVSLLGVIFSPALISIFSPGFKATPEQFNLAVLLNRIMFPTLFFLALFALFMGVLNTLGIFFAPAVASALLNICLIIAAFVSYKFKTPVLALAVAVTVSGALQLLLQLPFLKSKNFLLPPRFRGITHEHKHLLSLMIPSVLGFIAYSINIMITPAIGSLLRPGAISYLYYADRLVELPLAVIGIAFATAILPSLSRAVSRNDEHDFSTTLLASLRRLAFVSIPASVGLIILARPIVMIVFERGKFGPEATVATINALVAYAIGLVAFVLAQVMLRAFYALKDFWTPLASEIVAMVAFVLFSVFLVGPLKSQSVPQLSAIFAKFSIVPLAHVGIALAFSIAAYIQIIFLQFLLTRKIKGARLRSLALPVVKMLCAAIMMGAFLFLGDKLLAAYKMSAWFKAAILAALIVGGMFVYEAFALLFKEREAQSVWNELYRRATNWRQNRQNG